MCTNDGVFANGGVLHELPTSIHHWQLRDLVSPGDSEDEWYVVSHAQVVAYNTREQESTIVQDLSFAPISMTYGHGYLAAGGQRSELEVRDVKAGRTVFKASLGGTVNNALHIAPSCTGELSLFVCNNDLTVKVFTLPAMRPVASLRCHVPVNYTALSPCRSHLAAVGDCDSTMVYAATPAGYTMCVTYTEAMDAGMCCAWAPSGAGGGGTGLLASAHQDGTVCVFDLRCGSVVQKFRLQVAARCVKFAPHGVLDLLAFTEHHDHVHLVDTRRWDVSQVLHASSPAQGGAGHHRHHHHAAMGEQNISGIAFSKQGGRLLVGLDQFSVLYDVDTQARRSFPSGAIA